MKGMWLRTISVFIAMVLLSACSHQPKPTAVESAKGSFDELRVAVGETVKDPARSGELVGLVGELEQAMIEASEARKVHDARLRSLNANYDANEDDFRALFREFNAKKKERQDRILAIDERTRSLTTDVEWNALSKDVARALEASVKAEAGL